MIEALLLGPLLFGPAGRDWRPPELRVASDRVEGFEDLRALAFSYLGRPYATGGVGSPAFDCSGFTCRVFAEAGYPIPRVSRDQASAGTDVPIDRLLPGDLVFFADEGRPISHVGIFLGDGELVHASSTQGKVMVADLGSTWFSSRLVKARRVLTGTTADVPESPFVEAPAVELDEHAEPLLPMLRRKAKLVPPSFGPEVFDGRRTSVGLRAGLLTEDGVLGVTLTPEGTFAWEDWAFAISVAVPIRFELHEKPTLGRFERAGDYVRFLRSLVLGLPGADVEIRLSRLSDYSLGRGTVVRHFAPSVAARGVPAMTVQRTPLTLFAGVRTPWVEAEVLADDVFDPGVIGVATIVPIGDLPIAVSGGYTTDQHGDLGGRRAINAADAGVRWSAVDTQEISLDVAVEGAGIRALDRNGLLAVLSVEGEWRFDGYDGALTLGASAAYLGPRSLGGLFGPTYVADRSAHLATIAAARGRPVFGGELALRIGRFVVGGSFESGAGPNREALDQVVEGLLELVDLRIFGTQAIDLRVAYASRSLFRDEPRVDTLSGNLRYRWASWLFAEVHLSKGETWEGGGGLTITWMP